VSEKSHVAKRLRELREAHGTEDWGIPGVNSFAVVSIESDLRPPTPKMIKCICAFYKISEEDLVGEDALEPRPLPIDAPPGYTQKEWDDFRPILLKMAGIETDIQNEQKENK
jgi:hypothetical protein